MAHWAKSAAGTNLAFVKDVTAFLKSWREVFRAVFQDKPVHFRPKVQGLDASRSKAKDSCLVRIQTEWSPQTGKSFQSRLFNSLFSRTSPMCVAREMRKQVAVKLSSSHVRHFRNMPIMSLIGISLGVNTSELMDDGTERIMSVLQKNVQSFSWEAEPVGKLPTCLGDLEINETSLANGCDGVVYKAKIKLEAGPSDPTDSLQQPQVQVSSLANNCSDSDNLVTDTDYNLALKAVFNYGAESNAHSILRELQREIVPAHTAGCQLKDTPLAETVGRLPPHVNIVEMPGIFVDDVLITEDGKKKFPAALPRRLDHDNCYGRNKTLYLVMKRRSFHLRDYLSKHQVSMATRCQILAQILEGVSHLTKHGVAHRDLKADNILVDIPPDGGCPRVEICDFGCCLAEENRSLKVPYPTRDMYLGGNTYLMAPEIITATPGPNSFLNFTKSDLWAVGALAYEVFGQGNPFYRNQEDDAGISQFYSGTYTEEDLPPLSDEVPEAVRKLVRALLARDPKKRPSASVAASVLQMVVLSDWENISSFRQTTRKPQHMMGKKGVGKRDSHTRKHSIKHSSSSNRHQCAKFWYSNPLPLLGHCNELLPAELVKEKRWLHWIWTQGLALLCELKLSDDSKTWSMEECMRFQLHSRLTYSDLKACMNFF